MEWDTAAGDIILQEAGCIMKDLSTNQELKYNTRSLLNNFFIAAKKELLTNGSINY